MKIYPENYNGRLLVVCAAVCFCSAPTAQAAGVAETPYKIIATTKIPAAGGIDYVTADSINRKAYVACGKVVNVFDLDTYKLVGTLQNAAGHGVAIDPESHTGLVVGNPAVFIDTTTLRQIKTFPAPGADGYIFDPLTHHFFILSHRSPNLLVVDSKDGSIVGTVDAIGPVGTNAAVEQGASDGEGHLYFDVANQHHIALVDAKTLKLTGQFDLGENGKGPAGLALDAKNHILFAMCRGGTGGSPTCVILSSLDGKIITTLPLPGNSDGAAFNPSTMEAYSSHGNGTLSVIKEISPTEFVLEETVQTKAGAKTCTLDAKENRIVLITREADPAAPKVAATPVPTAPSGVPSSGEQPSATSPSVGVEGRGRALSGPQILDVLFVGR